MSMATQLVQSAQAGEAGDADRRGVDVLAVGRERERGGVHRHAEPGADALDERDATKGLRRGRPVGVRVPMVRRAGEDPAAEGRGVDRQHPAFARRLEHHERVAVDEVVVAVRQDRVEHPGPDVVEQQRLWLAGDADGVDGALVTQPHQRLDRATRAHRLGEADRVRVVDLQQRQAIQAEARDGLLERAPDAVTVEHPRLRVGVHLGDDDRAVGEPDPADRATEVLLAAARRIPVRRVDRREARPHHRVGQVVRIGPTGLPQRAGAQQDGTRRQVHRRRLTLRLTRFNNP